MAESFIVSKLQSQLYCGITLPLFEIGTTIKAANHFVPSLLLLLGLFQLHHSPLDAQKMTTSSPGTVIPFQLTYHAQLIPYIAALHASCITHDHTPATFVPPLSHEKLLYWWKDRIAEASAGTRLIYLLVRDDTSSLTVDLPLIGIKGTDVLGVVMLDMPPSETDVFRGSIEKLLIHTTHRRQGGARILIQALEAEALQRDKRLLVCSPYHHPCMACSFVLLIATCLLT